jgi:hypothetical protein
MLCWNRGWNIFTTWVAYAATCDWFYFGFWQLVSSEVLVDESCCASTTELYIQFSYRGQLASPEVASTGGQPVASPKQILKHNTIAYTCENRVKDTRTSGNQGTYARKMCQNGNLQSAFIFSRGGWQIKRASDCGKIFISLRLKHCLFRLWKG